MFFFQMNYLDVHAKQAILLLRDCEKSSIISVRPRWWPSTLKVKNRCNCLKIDAILNNKRMVCLERLVIYENQSHHTKAGNNFTFVICLTIFFSTILTKWQPMNELQCISDGRSSSMKLVYCFRKLLDHFTRGFFAKWS